MKSRKEQYTSRLAQLEIERASYEPAWRDITEHTIPKRTIWDVSETKRGEKKDSKILNNTPVWCAQTQAAGMTAGITPPTKHWMQLGPADPELAEHPQVKRYFHAARARVERALQIHGFYRALTNGGYLDVGTIGTAGLIKEEGPATLVPQRDGTQRLVPSEVILAMSIGEYYLDVDALGVVDTCYRKVQMNVRQMVKRFGLEACSQKVRDAWRDGNYHLTFTVIHAVQPNDEYLEGRLGRHGMKWASCWWELTDDRQDAFLRESGYEDFPVLAPRWFTRRGDAYGSTAPGWDCRGDCRGLQFYESRRLRITDKHGDASLVAEGDGFRVSQLPGDVTRVPKGSTFGVKPIYVPPPEALASTLAIVEAYEYRIERAFNVPLWRRLVDDERYQRATATEIEATQEEKALLQGPLLENLNETLLKPAVEGTYALLARARALPQPGDPDGPPPELDGADIKVEFISIMHQMQQALGLGGLRTFTDGVLSVAQAWPEALDRVDIDVYVEELAKSTSTRPDLVRAKEAAEAMRRAKAQMEQARQQSEAIESGARSFKDIASADPDNLQRLSEVVGQSVSPVAAAQGGAVPPAGAAA